jgi:hypothetical protein
MPAAPGILVALIGSLVLPARPVQTPAPGFANGVCTESPHVSDRPPDDPGASSFASPGATWFANDSRTLWAWWWGKTSDGSYKVLWVRPGRWLVVTGKRLDGPSAPMRADIPGGYDNTYQASGLDFPAPGCWQVDAAASGQTLRFVVRIP